MSEREAVVLLHGIARTRRSMAGLARFLEAQGFAVLNLDYPSRKLSLQEIAAHIHSVIETFIARENPPRVHFVGYSMGGLVIRAYLARFRPARLGCVVMLGTPNGGSEVADFLCESGFFRRAYHAFYGPAGRQLTTRMAQKEKADYALGIIAGDCGWDPLGKWLIRRPNDGKVAVDSTTLEGMRAQCVIRSGHTLLPARRAVWRNIAHFLREGAFAPQ